MKFANTCFRSQYIRGKFSLLEWQKRLLQSLWGWRHPTGARRFRMANLHASKKNGKTLLTAIVATFELFCSDSPSSLTLCSAASKENASQIFSECAYKVERIKSLFLLQPYVRSVTFGDPVGVIADGWRDHWKQGLNLTDQQAEFMNTGHPDRETPWLTVDEPNHVADVIVHRSPRYHSRWFPWKKIVREYKDKVVFVGSREEHAAFEKEFGAVPYHETPTLLDLARVIAGAKVFVGNQSSPRWIAEGLKKHVHVEQDRGRRGNTHWQRAGARYDADKLWAI
ncbi:terminase large subunit domain-containing protein [Limnoglobus roseus]|uniref:terminase large subunit domain-containing protein n=1 Tax=Limnoglobus roseus TaxID=2598579 RepID=UPI00143D5659|nr:terminase large subunit [Limnoglobus roseus]